MSLLSGYNHNVTTVTFSDQAADGSIGAFVAPFGGATVKAWYLLPELTVASSDTNYYIVTLIDGGATGTATTAIGTAAGSAAGVVANTKSTGTLNTALDELDAGDVLRIIYDEEGTVAPGELTVVIEWAHGLG